MRRNRHTPLSHAFTLVELLVVIAIVLLVTIIAVPAIRSALSGRQITDSARIFTGGLVGARDSAIKYNKPRGIRLMPDPVLTIPAIGSANPGTTQLCYNRYIPIEPAVDYSEGRVSIGPQYYSGGTPSTGFPTAYTTADGLAYTFPFFESPFVSQVLMVEESPYAGGFASVNAQPNSPTNFYWNVRVGDKIKIGGSGNSYTIVGPCVISPMATLASGNYGNPEMFVNVGAPGTISPLTRVYYPLPTTATPTTIKFFAKGNPEFLFVVNGQDDSVKGGTSPTGFAQIGYCDEGFDGRNNNSPPAPIPLPGQPTEHTDGLIDDLTEWETEKWLGALASDGLQDIPTNTPAGSPSADWLYTNYQKSPQDESYMIIRRPVPTQGAREVMLPVGMVIDATTWNSTQERSRIPVSPGSLYCDVMVNPSGGYVPSTPYSSLTSSSTTPFLHFWLCDRTDVYPVGTLPATAGFLLPMTTAALGGPATAIVAPTTDGQYYPGALTGAPSLKADRRLVTMFNQTGLIVTNTIESIPPVSAYQTGEGFYVGDVNYPFFRAQSGLREAR